MQTLLYISIQRGRRRTEQATTNDNTGHSSRVFMDDRSSEAPDYFGTLLLLFTLLRCPFALVAGKRAEELAAKRSSNMAKQRVDFARYVRIPNGDGRRRASGNQANRRYTKEHWRLPNASQD
jgi:hypothetical protein